MGVMRNMPMPRFVLLLFLLTFSTTGLNCAEAEDFMARGRDLEARTLYGPAMAEYQRAIKEDPANAAEAHYRIGVLSNRLGNTEGAVQEFQAALQINPHHAEARAAVAAFYVNRGAAARQQHHLDEALRELQEALKVDPGSSTTQLEGNPDKAEAYAGLGAAYFHQDQRDEAKKAFDKAIRLHLIAGRRDLAQKVKDEADTLMPPAPVAKPGGPRPAARK